MKISIIIPTFNRDKQLNYGLDSLSRQTLFNGCEILVVNDGDKGNTEDICKKYGVKYLYMYSDDKWRTPVTSLNTGVSQLTGDILIITTAEIYHIKNNNIETLIQPILDNEFNVGTCRVIDDNGQYLKQLETTNKIFLRQQNRLLAFRYPFLMAMKMQRWKDIGGYDTAFAGGRDYDDTDFVHRLVKSGCKLIEQPVQAIHLFHNRMTTINTVSSRHNAKIFAERKRTMYPEINI